MASIPSFSSPYSFPQNGNSYTQHTETSSTQSSSSTTNTSNRISDISKTVLLSTPSFSSSQQQPSSTPKDDEVFSGLPSIGDFENPYEPITPSNSPSQSTTQLQIAFPSIIPTEDSAGSEFSQDSSFSIPTSSKRKHVGDNIRAGIKHYNIETIAFAKLCGISKSSIFSFIKQGSGRHFPSTLTLKKIAEQLNIPSINSFYLPPEDFLKELNNLPKASSITEKKRKNNNKIDKSNTEKKQKTEPYTSAIENAIILRHIPGYTITNNLGEKIKNTLNPKNKKTIAQIAKEAEIPFRSMVPYLKMIGYGRVSTSNLQKIIKATGRDMAYFTDQFPPSESSNSSTGAPLPEQL